MLQHVTCYNLSHATICHMSRGYHMSRVITCHTTHLHARHAGHVLTAARARVHHPHLLIALALPPGHSNIFWWTKYFPAPVLAVLVALALGLAGLLLPVARGALLLQPLPALPPQGLVTRVTCDVTTRLLRLLVTQRHIPRHTLPRHGLQRGYSLGVLPERVN